MSLYQSAANLLEQIKEVIIQLSDEQFARPIASLSGSTIGQHVRHSLEFFICLQDALDDGIINYDNRKHDTLLQQDVQLAVNTAEKLQQKILNNRNDLTLVMEANYEIENEETLTISTTYLRELAYNIEHAIHHMALIKIGIIMTFPGVKLAPYFGVASSTVRYQLSKSIQ